MDVLSAFSVATAVLVSLGGGGLIVLGMGGWLGKVWANRLMAKDEALHARRLEELRATLTASNAEQIETLKHRLDLSLTSQIREVQDKFAIYRAAVDVVADLFTTLDRMSVDGRPPDDGPQRFDKFNRDRMRAYGYMAMLAPQPVMDAYDELTDYCLQVANGSVRYQWPDVRKRALALLNEVRKDVGIDKSPIEYRGKL